MIADMLSNKNLTPIVTELLPSFAVPKNISLNSAHYFVMKIPNKRKCQQVVFNH